MGPWLHHAVAAAYDAAQAILGLYGQAIEVEHKDDRSPLTAADRASHDLILGALQGLPAPLPVLSEESRETPYAERRGWTRFWLVDPLDGTKEFLKRNGEFTVNIALVEGAEPVLGVVYAPVLQTLYVGARGLGAFMAVQGDHFRTRADLVAGCLQPATAGWQALPRGGVAGSGSVRAVASRSHESDATRAFLEQLAARHGPVELVSIGSSLKLCLVAEGRADVYPRLAPTMEWDTAAAQAVVEAAGGSVWEYPSGERLRCNKPSLLNPSFVAGRTGWPTPLGPD